jgi:hypothetical protein
MSDVTGVTSASGGTSAATTKTTTTAKKTDSSFKETLAKVAGHKYAEIKNGDRKGMFVNQSGNDRNGQAFHLVVRNGHEFHVYGEGKNRRVFEVPTAKTASDATATTGS